LFAPAELKEDTSAFMKVHLNNQNFRGEIMPVYDALISRINEL
jgi:hypothetical protein